MYAVLERININDKRYVGGKHPDNHTTHSLITDFKFGYRHLPMSYWVQYIPSSLILSLVKPRSKSLPTILRMPCLLLFQHGDFLSQLCSLTQPCRYAAWDHRNCKSWPENVRLESTQDFSGTNWYKRRCESWFWVDSVPLWRGPLDHPPSPGSQW